MENLGGDLLNFSEDLSISMVRLYFVLSSTYFTSLYNTIYYLLNHYKGFYPLFPPHLNAFFQSLSLPLQSYFLGFLVIFVCGSSYSSTSSPIFVRFSSCLRHLIFPKCIRGEWVGRGVGVQGFQFFWGGG